MKVYRLKVAVNEYQSFLPKDSKVWQSEKMMMDCKSKKNTWNNIEFYILQTNLKKGNFFGGIPGVIIIDEIARQELTFFWEASGELLPFTYKDEKYYLFNGLNCYDLLDDEKTEWVYGQTTKKKIRISKYEFYPERFTETPLFKIPETIKTEILTVEGLKDSNDEFIYQVKRRNLKGLIFEKIWSD